MHCIESLRMCGLQLPYTALRIHRVLSPNGTRLSVSPCCYTFISFLPVAYRMPQRSRWSPRPFICVHPDREGEENRTVPIGQAHNVADNTRAIAVLE